MKSSEIVIVMINMVLMSLNLKRDWLIKILKKQTFFVVNLILLLVKIHMKSFFQWIKKTA